VITTLRTNPEIRDVIIGNEPNTPASWAPQFDESGAPASPRAYTRLLATCDDNDHTFRSDVNVITPATSSRGNDSPRARSNAWLSPTRLIAEMEREMRALGRGCPLFDTIDHHPY
jgi:hypothetical protein